MSLILKYFVMKRLLFIIIICPYLAIGQTTTDTEQNPTNSVPISGIDRDGNHFSFTVEETYQGEFEENPVGFVKTILDVKGLLKTLTSEKIDNLYLTLLSSRGKLNVHVSEDGDVEYNSHRCKNILVPMSIRKQLYRDYKGWTMVKNVHIAKGRNNVIDKEFYKIKLQKGNSTKRIKMSIVEPNPFELTSVHKGQFF